MQGLMGLSFQFLTPLYTPAGLFNKSQGYRRLRNAEFSNSVATIHNQSHTLSSTAPAKFWQKHQLQWEQPKIRFPRFPCECNPRY